MKLRTSWPQDSERTPPYAGMTTNLKVNIAYRDPLAATKYFRGSELDFTKKLARIVATFRNLESLRVLVQVATESNHNTNVKQYVWYVVILLVVAKLLTTSFYYRHHLKHLVWWYKYEFPELELYIWAVEDDCWNKIEEGSMVDRRMVNYRESLRIAGVLWASLFLMVSELRLAIAGLY